MGTPQSELWEDTVQPHPVRPFRAVQRGHRLHEHAAVLAVVAAGGAIGACGRYGASLLWPTAPGAFPWSTMAVNITGCATMGIVMVLISDVWPAHRLLRPFVGTGILGGYTTFSAYAAEIQHLVNIGHAAIGLAYLALTVLTAVGSTWTAATLTQRAFTTNARSPRSDTGAGQ